MSIGGSCEGDLGGGGRYGLAECGLVCCGNDRLGGGDLAGVNGKNGRGSYGHGAVDCGGSAGVSGCLGRGDRGNGALGGGGSALEG